MFDLDQFIADCREAVAADPSHKLAREIVARAVADPTAVIKGLGEPKLGHVDTLYRGEDVTILNVVWGPLMTIMPHEHRMWAVIGIYAGAEDNMYWRRIGEPGRSKVGCLFSFREYPAKTRPGKRRLLPISRHGSAPGKMPCSA